MNIRLSLNKLHVPVDHFTFSGGEEQVKIDTHYVPKGSIGFVDIFARIKNSQDVMCLMMLVDAVNRLGNLDVGVKKVLHLPYIPYARQDRVMNPGEALSVKVFATMINSLGFHKVIVDDPHSDVSAALIDNVKIRSQTDLFLNMKFDFDLLTDESLVLVAPDAGARKKTQKVADTLELSVVEAGKIRDVSTGAITGTTVFGDVGGKTCLIVDDICDGGFTFTNLAQALKAAGAKRVILYVTHGIFSRGKEFILDGGVDEIYAYYDWSENF